MNSLLAWFTPTRWIILGVVLLALIAAGWRVHHSIWQAGYDERDNEAKAAQLRAFRENDRIQVGMQADANRLQGAKDATIRSINARLADALGDYSMLQRSTERRGPDMPGDPGACAGGTGAGLSRPDAGFLEGEAARANRLRAALDACQKQYATIRRAQPKAAEKVSSSP